MIFVTKSVNRSLNSHFVHYLHLFSNLYKVLLSQWLYQFFSFRGINEQLNIYLFFTFPSLFLFLVLGYLGFTCFLFGTGDYISNPRHCCILCWKGLWADRTRTSFGCFWFGHCYGFESSGGNNTIYRSWWIPPRSVIFSVFFSISIVKWQDLRVTYFTV